MKNILYTILLLASTISSAVAQQSFTMAIQPTFGAHQHIGYEIIRRLEQQGVTVNTVKTKSSIKGNGLLMSNQIDVNVGAITSFVVLNSKMPGQAKLLSAIGHYKFFLQCTSDIKNMQDVKTTKIVTSGRNTSEHHTIRWLAKKHYGDAFALEENFITMPRPQILQMFKAGSTDIKCVMTGAPLQNVLQDEVGLVTVEESDFASGIAGSYNAYWTRTDWVEQNPELAKLFTKTAVEVLEEFNQNPDDMLNQFVKTDRMEITVDQLKKGYSKNKAAFHADLRGAQYFSDFLYEVGYLTENQPKNLDDHVAVPELIQ